MNSNKPETEKTPLKIENVMHCSVCGIEMQPQKTAVIRRFFDYVSGGTEVTTSWKCNDCGKLMTITEK